MATTSRRKSTIVITPMGKKPLDSMRSGQSAALTSSITSRNTSSSDASKRMLGSSTSGISLVSAKTTTVTRKTGASTATLTCTGGRSTGSRTSSNTTRRSRAPGSWKCRRATRAKRVASAVGKTTISVSSAVYTRVRNATMRSTLM